MILDFENSRTAQTASGQAAASGGVEAASPAELFAEFYQMQNNDELSAEQLQLMENIFERGGGADI